MAADPHEKRRRERITDDARYAARRMNRNAYVCRLDSKPGHFEIIHDAYPPFGRDTVAGWKPDGTAIELAPVHKRSTKTYEVYAIADPRVMVHKICAYTTEEARRKAADQYGPDSTYVVQEGPDSAERLAAMIARAEKQRAQAEEKAARKARRERQDREREEKRARAPKWGDHRTEPAPPSISEQIEKVKHTWTDQAQAGPLPPDFAEKAWKDINATVAAYAASDPAHEEEHQAEARATCDCCGAALPPVSVPGRCPECVRCSPEISAYSPTCKANRTRAALGSVAEERHQAAAAQEAPAPGSLADAIDRNRHRQARWKKAQQTINRIRAAWHAIEDDGRQEKAARIIEKARKILDSRPARDIEAARLAEERANGDRHGFPVTAGASGGGYPLKGAPGPQPQGPIPRPRWTAARQARAAQLRQARIDARAEEDQADDDEPAPPAPAWHVYRITPDGRLWAGPARLARSTDPAPIVAHRSVYALSVGKALSWQTDRAKAQRYADRRQAENHVLAQGWAQEDIRAIAADAEPSVDDEAPKCNGPAFDAECRRRRQEEGRQAAAAAAQEAPAPKKAPRPFAFVMIANMRDGSQKTMARVAATAASAEKAALRTKGVESVRNIMPITEAEYTRAYGIGRRAKV